MVEYLRQPRKPEIHAIFILDPKFIILPETDAYTCTVDIEQSDFEAVQNAMSGCLLLDKNQDGCEEGKKRYFCMSWVTAFLFR